MWAEPDMMSGDEASERMVYYYSHLFTYPSRPRMVLATIIITVGSSIISFFLIQGADSLIPSLAYGVLGLSAPLLLADEVSSRLLTGEPILNPRRFTIITFSTSLVYGALGGLSALAGALSGRADTLFRGLLLAVAVCAALRYFVIQVFAQEGQARKLIAAFMQPAFCLAAGVFLLPGIGLWIPFLGIVAGIILVSGAHYLLVILGHWGGDNSKVKLVRLFRAFVLAWAEGLPTHLEEEITLLGEERDLPVDALLFKDQEGGNIVALVVPYIHPGPFRNVGGSGLPSILVDSLSRRLGCEVIVAHGVSNHERDLTRAADAERVQEALAEFIEADSGDTATPLKWGKKGIARSSCQIFGDTALFTLSLSPLSHDDLPDRVEESISEVTEAMGLRPIVVDSHNSIRLNGDLDGYDAGDLVEAATLALEAALNSSRSHYSIGASRVIPTDWGLDEGIGPDGFAALSVTLEGGQRSVYVVVDGNNMVSGLRERIVGAVRGLGVDEVEVMTSDTHLVNAIGATEKGYFPIGERTDPEGVLDHVVGVVERAGVSDGRCRVLRCRGVVEGLTVLGAVGLNALRHVLESGFDLFRRAGIVAMMISVLLAGSVLFLL
jgi:putative membrane protein